jgi:nucleotide-binding universal stress UspA family protein
VADRHGLSINPILVDSHGHSVAHHILRQCRKLKADVIVMGTHGHRGLRRLVMGSDAENVVREADVPVVLVRSAKRPRRVAAPSRGAVSATSAPASSSSAAVSA